MTGPEHYREAERLLDSIGPAMTRGERIGASGNTVAAALNSIIARAQVHATLALTAATAASTQSSMFTASPQWQQIVKAS